jgi:hypothetical protein
MKRMKQPLFFLIFMSIALGLWAQTDTLGAPSATTRGDMKARMASPRTAHGEILQRKAIPTDLGGGTTAIYKVVVKDVFKNRSHIFLPSDFEGQNLQLARWMDNRYFMFIATDFVDITGYYLYDTERDKVYACLDSIGEELGYLEIKPGQTFDPVVRENKVNAWILKP